MTADCASRTPVRSGPDKESVRRSAIARAGIIFPVVSLARECWIAARLAQPARYLGADRVELRDDHAPLSADVLDDHAVWRLADLDDKRAACHPAEATGARSRDAHARTRRVAATRLTAPIART